MPGYRTYTRLSSWSAWEQRFYALFDMKNELLSTEALTSRRIDPRLCSHRHYFVFNIVSAAGDLTPSRSVLWTLGLASPGCIPFQSYSQSVLYPGQTFNEQQIAVIVKYLANKSFGSLWIQGISKLEVFRDLIN